MERAGPCPAGWGVREGWCELTNCSRSRRTLWVLFLSAVIALGGSAAFAQPYVLQLDTGGHQGDIKDVIFTRDGTQIISAGDDKIIRVWDWRAGQTIRTIRGQIQPGNSGKIYALALSPDERWLAAAGWMDQSDALEPCCGDIRVFEFATGKLASVLKGHSNAVYDLAFSRDSRLLASVGADQSIIMWNLETMAQMRQMDEASAHADRIVRVEFADEGAKLVTAGYDGHVKLWSTSDGKLVRDVHRHGTRVYALAVSPDASSIASGDAKGEIKLWQAATNATTTLAQQGATIGALSFNPDATLLVSTCGYECPAHPGEHVWEVATGRLLHVYKGHDDSVRAVTISPDGAWVATAGGENNEIHIWELRTGRLERTLKGRGAIVYAVGVSKDGRRLAWGNQNPCPGKTSCSNAVGKLQQELVLPDQTHALEPPAPLSLPEGSFLRAVDQVGSWSAQLVRGGKFDRPDAILRIRQGDAERSLIERGSESGFAHSAYSFLRGGAVLASGGDHGKLATYQTRGGKQLKEFVGHTSIVTAIAASQDSKYLYTASADQTVRLWNAETGELVVSMLFAIDGEWVIWTEQGYYASSPGGDRMVGWQINQGPEHEARYVTARQMKERLHNPEIIRRAITLGSAERAIRQLRPSQRELGPLLAVSPPAFEIATPRGGGSISRDTVAIMLDVAAGENPLTRVEVIVNNRNVTSAEHARIAPGRSPTLTVPLNRDRNNILIVGYNDVGYTSERTLELTNTSEGSLDQPGHLYVVAIGVNNYPKLPHICGGPAGTCELEYAVTDAREFHDTVVRTVMPKHKGASSLLFINNATPIASKAGQSLVMKEPTAENIVGDISKFFASAEPQDTVILFLAGHGVNIDGRYHFLPTNARTKADQSLNKDTLVPWHVLQNAVQSARGTRLMFLDTCHSGNAYNASLEKDAGDARIIVYSATKANSLSFEVKALGHGAFTQALISGLSGEADYNKDQTIEVFELNLYAANEVKRLTRNSQSTVFYSSGVENFVLAWP
jgi:WD40 repeat protein